MGRTDAGKTLLRSLTLALLLGATAASPAFGATITVSTTADNVAGNTTANVGSCGSGGACTLRQAINFADVVANAGTVITVPAGTYTLTPANLALPQLYQST